MKIKTKKQLNLPQLIEYIWDKDIKNECFRRLNRGPFEYVWVNEDSDIEFDDDILFRKNDIFEIEIEEEIDENTEFKSIVEVTTDDLFAFWKNESINTWKNKRSKEFHAYIDGEFKLIWHDGKLVD